MKRFLAALRFMTVLPVPGSWGTGEAELSGSVPMFPLVGLLLGAIAAGVAWGMARLSLPPMVASAAMIVILLAFSGALHMDGLSDTADGFLSSRPRERILEIMKDSHVGAMGMIAVVSVLLMKFAALASVPPERWWHTVWLMPVAGRCMIVVQMAILPYARPGGLGKIFYSTSHRAAALWAVLVLIVAGAYLLCNTGLAVAGACLGVTLLFSWYSRRKIGGATGDTFGAGCEIAETLAALVVACAR